MSNTRFLDAEVTSDDGEVREGWVGFAEPRDIETDEPVSDKLSITVHRQGKDEKLTAVIDREQWLSIDFE